MLYFQYVLIKFYAGMGIKKNGGKQRKVLNVERYYYIYVDDNNKIKFHIVFDDYFEREKVVIPRSAELVHSLTNIIDNAFKYAINSVEISLKNEQEKIIIEIVDDGPGFASEIYPFLGEPYLRNNRDKNKEGLGLGLFISKNLLAKSLGEIKFLYRKNKGGCVQVILIKSALGLQNE